MIHLFAALSNEEADMEVQKIIERSMTLKRHFGANRQVGSWDSTAGMKTQMAV